MELKPGYKQTEAGIIPEDWGIKKLGEITSIATGNTPPTRNAANYGDEFLFVSPVDLGDEQYITHTEKRLSKTGFAISRRFPKGSILYVCIGSTIGKSGIASVELTSNQQINAIFPSPIFSGEYLYFFSGEYLYYSVSALAPKIRALAGEQAVPIVNKGQFSDTVVAFPPLPEQRAIAGALSDVDALIRALDQLIAKKRDIKQAAMQQLLTGKQRLPGFGGEREVKRIGDIADVDSDNLGSDTQSNYRFNYISLEDVDSGSLKSYSEQAFRSAPSRARRKLRNGDILVATVRPNLKSHLLFAMDSPDWICSTGFSIVRCKQQVADPGYVFFHLFGNVISKQIETLLTGSNYPAINGGDVKALEIPMPRIEEQTAIATVLSDMNAEINALEQKRDKTRAIKQGMMQELLTGRTRLPVPAGNKEVATS